MMSNTIDQLMPQGNQPAAQGGGVQSVADKFPLLYDLVQGDPAAVYAPKGWQPTPELEAMTSQPVIKSLGLSVYRPHDDSVMAVLFNPTKITSQELLAADKEGKLTQVAAPVSDYLGEAGNSSAGGPTAGLLPAQDPTASQPSAPSPEAVPVLPRPAMGADAQAAVAQRRATNFAPQAPTATPGGNILDSLLRRAQ